jgi:polar amino acid transport system substrate-binding protein
MKLVLLMLVTLSFSTHAKDLKFFGQDYPPFNYLDGAKATGALPEILKAACTITKDTCTVEVQPLKRALSLLETGEANGVVALLKNTDRDAIAIFSEPLIKSDMVYASLKTTADVKSTNEFKGWTLAAVAGSASAKIALAVTKENEGSKLVEDSDNDTVIKKMSAGRYGEKSAIIINEDVMSYLSKKNSISNLKKLFTAKSDEFGIYFSKKSMDQASIDKLNNAFSELKKNGDLAKILTKFGLK